MSEGRYPAWWQDPRLCVPNSSAGMGNTPAHQRFHPWLDGIFWGPKPLRLVWTISTLEHTITYPSMPVNLLELHLHRCSKSSTYQLSSLKSHHRSGRGANKWELHPPRFYRSTTVNLWFKMVPFGLAPQKQVPFRTLFLLVKLKGEKRWARELKEVDPPPCPRQRHLTCSQHHLH